MEVLTVVTSVLSIRHAWNRNLFQGAFRTGFRDFFLRPFAFRHSGPFSLHHRVLYSRWADAAQISEQSVCVPLSAMKNGATWHAGASALKMLRSPSRSLWEAIREEFRRLLPPLSKIALRINQGLDAKYSEFVKHEGRITHMVERVDFTERRQYAELAARLHDLLPESSRITATASATAIAGVTTSGTAFEMYEAEWLRERKQEWDNQLKQRHASKTLPK